MNILMLTNTFTPHVGGVARSVEAFTRGYRAQGHRVLVVAPEFEDMPEDETDVVRIPAVANVNDSGFSLALPIPGLLSDVLDDFRPDIAHSHHPYLLGMTAVRVARYRDLPLVFTHHTLYEEYTHYVSADWHGFRRFVAELATRYANLCDQVFAPSESIAALLRQRGVAVPIEVLPTGVEIEAFAHGDGAAFRRAAGIPDNAFVAGHLGRLAPEKNLTFLAEAVAGYLEATHHAHFLVVGKGPSEAQMLALFENRGLADRVHFAGLVRPPRLADAYQAMDVFAFASKSETQGMVLTEAMAAGVPVVGLDAPGVREVVRDGENGRLLHDESAAAFAAALGWVTALPPDRRQRLRENALATAEAFAMPRCVERALGRYERLLETLRKPAQSTQWDHILDLIKAEWDLMRGMAEAARFGFASSDDDIKMPT